MKRAMFTMFTALTVFNIAFASEIKQYWDRFYNEIKQCIMDNVKSETFYKPEIQPDDAIGLKSYLKALDYSNYVVYIRTENIKESDLCFIRYSLKELGYNPKYYKPAEILVVDQFQRKVDAQALKQKVETLFKPFLQNHTVYVISLNF